MKYFYAGYAIFIILMLAICDTEIAVMRTAGTGIIVFLLWILVKDND